MQPDCGRRSVRDGDAAVLYPAEMFIQMRVEREAARPRCLHHPLHCLSLLGGNVFFSLLLNNCFCISSSVHCASLAVCHGNDGGNDSGVMMIMTMMKLAIMVDGSGDDDNNRR